MEWFFDGIGSEIIGIVISLIIGAIGGGAVGYRIGIKHTFKQSQKAGNNSKQRQEMTFDEDLKDLNSVKTQNRIRQTQRAGDGSAQSQVGGITNGRK